MRGNICKEKRMAYVGLPRTGSRYIWSILRPAGFTTDRPDQVHTHKVPEYKEDWTYLVSCRNPYQRMVSYYTIAIGPWGQEWKNFEEFVLNFKCKSVYDSVKHLKNIRFIHFENIVEDLGDLCIQSPPLFVESEESKNWKDFYTPELEKIVYKLFENDFKYCDYSRETF